MFPLAVHSIKTLIQGMHLCLVPAVWVHVARDELPFRIRSSPTLCPLLPGMAYRPCVEERMDV